jgi:4-hydroxybenzoate polyprenyltransferase
MRQTMWSMALGGLAFGSLAMVGGTAIGGELGPLAIGYGLLVALAALYLFAGLAIRERAWRRLSRPMPTTAQPDRLAGRRVF